MPQPVQNDEGEETSTRFGQLTPTDSQVKGFCTAVVEAATLNMGIDGGGTTEVE